jgi:Kef-type K+ transport system membrane component KefB
MAEKSVDVLSDEGAFSYNWIQEIALQNRLFATLFLTMGLLTEFFAFLVWWKPYRTYMFIAIIGLHMGIHYTMNILFLSYTIGLFIIGLPWYRVINWTIDHYQINVEDYINRLKEIRSKIQLFTHNSRRDISHDLE